VDRVIYSETVNFYSKFEDIGLELGKLEESQNNFDVDDEIQNCS